MLELRPRVVRVEGSRDNGCRPGGTCGRQRGWASMCGQGVGRAVTWVNMSGPNPQCPVESWSKVACPISTASASIADISHCMARTC